jgi:hypothetical protein
MPQKKVKNTNSLMCRVMFEAMGNTTIMVYVKQSQCGFNCVKVCGLVIKPKDGEQVALLHICILYNALSSSRHVYKIIS